MFTGDLNEKRCFHKYNTIMKCTDRNLIENYILIDTNKIILLL